MTNAKEFLRRYERASHRAERLKLEYEAEKAAIDTVRSTLGGDGMPHGTGVSRKVENDAIRLADKAMAWKMAELDAIEERQEVFALIYDIPGVEGDVLIERYLNLHRWEDICVLLHYSWHGIHAAHRRALKIVDERLNIRALNGTQ